MIELWEFNCNNYDWEIVGGPEAFPISLGQIGEQRLSQEGIC